MSDTTEPDAKRPEDAPSVVTHPRLYTGEVLPDGRVAVQCSHSGTTYPVEYYATVDEAAVRLQQLMHLGKPLPQAPESPPVVVASVSPVSP